MTIRDAAEADADALAQLADSPRDVLLQLIHDRSVKVCDKDGSISAFISYDARPGTVYITQMAGEAADVKRLLDEPIRFATQENMQIEVLIAASNSELVDVITELGFTNIGQGPGFDGVQMERYRHEPSGQD